MPTYVRPMHGSGTKPESTIKAQQPVTSCERLALRKRRGTRIVYSRLRNRKEFWSLVGGVLIIYKGGQRGLARMCKASRIKSVEHQETALDCISKMQERRKAI